MRIPLTKYGLPQVAIFPILVCVVMAALFFILRPSMILIPIEIILFFVLVWMFSFFRDPLRAIQFDENILLSPADGTITEIVVVEDSELGAPALKIGMFLSVFNVHVNRVPCSVRIEKVVYKKGKFINAMSADSGRINEANDIFMQRLSNPKDRLLVRQVSGAIARHIVCEAKVNSEYRQGTAFGMIKFGSRAEVYLPAGPAKHEVMVKVGDPVRAGLTPLLKYLP